MLQATRFGRDKMFQACGRRIPAKAFVSRARRSVLVRANWGAPVEFSGAKVVSNKILFPGMHQVMLDVGSTVAATYTKPGQYIQAKVTADAKPGFFAVASAPSTSSTVELLVKTQPGSSAEAINALHEGGSLLVSPAQGKGFPVEKIPSSEVDVILMFATGSGVSPLKAVIESGILNPSSRKQVRLFYGTKDKDTTAYHDLMEKWASAGIKVTQVFSSSDKNYIQTALEDELNNGALISPGSEGRVGVLLCGHKDMCNAVTALLTERGVSKDRILLNF